MWIKRLLKVELNKAMKHLACTLFFACHSSYASSPECVANGGNKLCFKPSVTEWRYGAYDGLSDFSHVIRARCLALDGTWMGIYGGCPNTKELTDFGMATYTEKLFNDIKHIDTCNATETSWGQSGNWGMYNYHYEPSYVNGILVADYKFLTTDCYGSTVYGSRSRQLVCPSGVRSETVNGQTLCIQEQQFGSCGVGNPILPFSGRKIQKEVDLENPIMDLERHYNSTGWMIPSEATANIPASSEHSTFFGQLGNYWRTNFDLKLYHLSGTVARYAISFPSGELLYFAQDFSPIVGMYKPALLKKEGALYILDVDGNRYSFSEQGYLKYLHLSQGVDLELKYSGLDYVSPITSVSRDGAPDGRAVPNGLLISVSVVEGDFLYTFFYDMTGLLITAQRGSESIRYVYNSKNNLDSRQYVNGDTKSYFYIENSGFQLLSEIVDENGVQFAKWTYDHLGRAYISEHHNGKEKTLIDFSRVLDPTSPRVTVTNPLGKTATYHYKVVKGIQKITHVEGHASTNCAAANKSYTYYPNGTLQTKTDWSGNVTSYVRDNFGREISRIEAAGTPVARTISTEYHPTLDLPIQITERGRIQVMTYDKSGRLLTRNIQSVSIP